MEFQKAVKNQSKLRIALSGAAGSGKTYSALQIAKGIGVKIAVIDTERGSASLYADIFDFDVLNIDPPYTPAKYIDAIATAEKSGYNVIIIDSLSHAWAGAGGLLDMHDAIQKSSKSGNGYTAWREITPIHNKLVDAIVGSRCHVIATMRSKMEYVIENTGSKNNVRKVGMAPIQRDDLQYEFSVHIELSQEHVAISSKDRTGLFDGKYFVPSEQTGVLLISWLNSPASKPQHQSASNSDNKPAPLSPVEENSEQPKKAVTIQDIAKILTPELKTAFNQKQVSMKRIFELWEKFNGDQAEILRHLEGTTERRAA